MRSSSRKRILCILGFSHASHGNIFSRLCSPYGCVLLISQGLFSCLSSRQNAVADVYCVCVTGLTTEGIYRLCGQQSVVTRLLNSLTTGWSDYYYLYTLWKIDLFINIFKALYDNSSCCVKTASGYTEFFEIVSGVRQGCILSPFFFIIVIDFIMLRTMDKLECGIVWQKRNRLTDLDFADDIAIVAEEENVYQEMTTKLEEQSAQVGLNIGLSREKKRRPWESPSAHHHN